MTTKPFMRHLADAYVDRLSKTIHTYTPKKLILVTVLWLINGIGSLFTPWIGLLAILFGIVGLVHSMFPHMYPFTFQKPALWLFRIAALIYGTLGVVGTYVQWPAMQPFLQPIINWINS